MSYEIDRPFFARREHRFFVATMNQRGVWSYQIDGTFTKDFEVTVFYSSPKGPYESLGGFARIEDAEARAERHFAERA